MKSTISVPATRSFPKLMRSRKNGSVVLMLGTNGEIPAYLIGVVLCAGKGNGLPNGTLHREFDSVIYEDFEGSVTLENE